MANEITIKASLSYAKSGQTVISRSNPTAAGDVLTQKSANFRYVNRVQNIGNTEEALGLGDVSSPGISWFQNLGLTTISIRAGSGDVDVVNIEAGEWAMFRFATATPWAIADTNASDLEYFIIDD